VFLNVSTIGEIIDYIVNARKNASELYHYQLPIVCFHWQPSRVRDLDEQLHRTLIEVDEMKIRRFEYDYESETVYLDISPQSSLQYQVQAGIRDHLKDWLTRLVVATDSTAISELIESAEGLGPYTMEYGNKLYKQADVSFVTAGTLPFLVCEVS
jgi:FMN phosphatase YigB (HAD superfamily)